MTENFPNWIRETNPQIQKAEQPPNKINSRQSMLRHIITSEN